MKMSFHSRSWFLASLPLLRSKQLYLWRQPDFFRLLWRPPCRWHYISVESLSSSLTGISWALVYTDQCHQSVLGNSYIFTYYLCSTFSLPGTLINLWLHPLTQSSVALNSLPYFHLLSPCAAFRITSSDLSSSSLTLSLAVWKVILSPIIRHLFFNAGNHTFHFFKFSIFF